MSDKLSKAELHAQKACELEAFKSIKLDALKDKVTQMLAHIGDGRIFDQYTKHDISHINKMLESLDYIIHSKCLAIQQAGFPDERFESSDSVQTGKSTLQVLCP